MAIGVLRAAHRQGLSVPGRLSIIGFDDIFGSDFTAPPLTTIRSPLALLGELAVGRVLDLVAAAGESASRAFTNSTIATELVPRGTTGAVSGRWHSSES